MSILWLPDAQVFLWVPVGYTLIVKSVCYILTIVTLNLCAYLFISYHALSHAGISSCKATDDYYLLFSATISAMCWLLW